MAEHAGHDPVVVAAAADRGGRLAGVLAACTDCVMLLRDLRALALATPTAAIPQRPRDLRLTIDDARRLRQRGWTRVLAGLGAGREALARPLAMSLTTLGLIGLLLGSVPAVVPLGGASSPNGAAVDATQPLRTTDAPGDIEASGSPDRAAGDAPTRTTSAPAVDGSLLRLSSIILLGLGVTAYVVGHWAAARGRMR